MTTPNDIGWGSYNGREGPYFRGTKKFQLPANPTEDYKLLAVVTSTEGGTFNAVNAYDRCIISVGLLQWCEAKYFLTSKLLGAIADEDAQLLVPLLPALNASNAQFMKKNPGKWRFFERDGCNEVDTGEEQKKLFLLNSSGHQGSWDDESKEHAKLWASCMANVLEQDLAMDVQARYTANRIRMFATRDAKSVLFDDTPSDGWVGAIRSIFLSFAANLPAVADRQLKAALTTTDAKKWSEEWCVHAARTLTFGPGISIYPHRYNSIRPVVERLYGVNLPDMASELKSWKVRQELECVTEDIMDESPSVPTFTTVKEVQRLLERMGYDLGPAGVDGWMGRKTKEALITFQGNVGLKADGILGKKTRTKMAEAWALLVCV